MRLLKNLSIGYKAFLKDIRLINFSVEEDELRPSLPLLPLVRMNNRPIISLLDVKLHRLKPSFLVTGLHFNYRHIAFRVLIKDDGLHGDGINRGIYYLHSFTDNPFIVRCGKIFTNFNFRHGYIREHQHSFSLYHGGKWISYELDFNGSGDRPGGLMQNLMQIDRAYSLNEQGMKYTRVRRNDLPLRPVSCTRFDTNFFSSARLIDAYYVNQTLDYEWLPAERCNLVPL